MIQKLSILIFTTLIVVSGINAQQHITAMGVRSDVEDVRNGRKFFVHTVKPGETLYSISKTYQVPMHDITVINADMLNNLTEGQTIHIPIQSITADDEGATYFFFFVAEKDMSLYQAAKFYKFEVEEFLKFNPQASTGVKAGQVIKVPKTRSTTIEEFVADSVKADTPNFDLNIDPPCENYIYKPKETTFRCAILLPFQRGLNSEVFNANYNALDKVTFNPSSVRFLEYMQGVQMAANDLRMAGLNIDIKLFDTERSTDKVKRIIELGGITNADLILGPVYSDTYQVVADAIEKEHQVQVSLLSQNNRLIADNNLAFQVVPAESTQWRALADYYILKRNKNFILIHKEGEDELETLEAFKQQLAKSVDLVGGKVTVSVVNYKVGGLAAIKSKLNHENNVIVVPSKSEVFVTDLAAKLYSLTDSYPIEVAGSQSWETFENVTFEFLHKLQFAYPSSSWVDYNNDQVKAFVEEYRTLFKNEPSLYAFYGYDTFLYFASQLKSNGPNFAYCVNDKTTQALQSIWNFKHTSELGGLENNGVWVIKYDLGVGQSFFKVYDDGDRKVERIEVKENTEHTDDSLGE